MNTIEKAVQRFRKAGLAKGRSDIEATTKHKPLTNSDLIDSRSGLEIDFLELADCGYLTPDQSNQLLTDEYRIIKRPLLKNAFGKGVVPIKNGNVIMISSALPGEGKTFTAMNLAVSIAMEKDTTVLLVDSDVTKPALSKLLKLEERAGFTDVITESNIKLSDVIIRTNLKRLSVMPAGTSRANTTELLASQQLLDVIDELSSRYPDRVIIFDLPPIMVTTHAEVMLENAGQILLVIEEGKTPEHVIKEAISKFNQDTVLGLVLNKCHSSQKSDYYGTYGNYGNQ